MLAAAAIVAVILVSDFCCRKKNLFVCVCVCVCVCGCFTSIHDLDTTGIVCVWARIRALGNVVFQYRCDVCRAFSQCNVLVS